MARRPRAESRARQRERQAGEAGGWLTQIPYAELRNPYKPFEILSADELNGIHEASLTVLEEIGINFLLPEAVEILKQAGADIDSDGIRVRMDRAMVLDAVAKAPTQFRLHARNPAHSLTIGGNVINFASVGSPPNASDMVGGRRRGNKQDYSDFLRLCQFFNVCHLPGGYPVEPQDIETPIRHIEAMRLALELTDKAVVCYSLGRQRVLDTLDMIKIARGIDEDTLLREPSLWTIVNANSPLQFDKPMLWGMIEMAKRNQVVCVTPFTLSGAMAPVTIPGALVQQNAEALAGIAFLQTVNPGAPSIYGGFTSNVDMKTGSPAFGTPEYSKATLIGSQLARSYGLPFRASNVNASNAPDVQAAYESEMSVWATTLGHTNLVNHGFGWLEGGLCASFEKFIIDVEILQMMSEFLKPMVVDEASLGLDAIREVGPGGHFFAAQHTLERYDRAFYPPVLSDWRNFETWEEDGARTATERAHNLYKQVLHQFEAPAMDPGINEELNAFATRRISEGGAPAQ